MMHYECLSRLVQLAACWDTQPGQYGLGYAAHFVAYFMVLTLSSCGAYMKVAVERESIVHRRRSGAININHTNSTFV